MDDQEFGIAKELNEMLKPTKEEQGAIETGVTLNCEKHGDYPEREMNLCGRKIPVKSCPTCLKEEREEREAAVRNEEEKRALLREREQRKQAGVSPRNENVRFKAFIKDTPEQKHVYDSVYSMAKAVHEGVSTPNVILTGKVGTGKTMLANCAINALFKTKNVKLIKLQDMLRKIKGSYNRESNYTEEEAIDAYASFDLLILDEVGVSRDTDNDKNLIFDVLDGRYQNMLPTMIISNMSIEGIKETLGDRVVDRLRDGGGVLLGCDWDSFRK